MMPIYSNTEVRPPKFKIVIDGFGYNSETSEVLFQFGPRDADDEFFICKSAAGAYFYCDVNGDRANWDLRELQPGEICEMLQDMNWTQDPLYEEMFAKVPEIGSK